LTVEILYLDGCPNHEPLIVRVQALLKALGIDERIECRPVDSDDAAVALCFLGSPTLRIDGTDVEPGAELRTDYGLKCRLYHTPAGVTGGMTGQPSDAWIRAAITPSRRQLTASDPWA
jgi:hypothetical protein